MTSWQNFVVPDSLAEALRILETAGGSALPIAGGTDLLIDIQQGRHAPAKTLVDLTRVPEMKVIEVRGGDVFIGAAVPLSRVAQDPLVLKNAEAVAEASELIGGPQVRNVATLGGNVAHALPAADGTIALLCAGAVAEVVGPSGKRNSSLPDLFRSAGESTLVPGRELLLGFRIALAGRGEASAFKRVMRPQGVALPILNVAIWVARSGSNVRDVRIAVGPGASVPWRAKDAERVLAGRVLSDELVGRALEALLASVGFRSSPRRGTADYRRHLVEGLFADTLAAAWTRALGKG